MFGAGSSPARGVLEIYDGETLLQWPQMEIGLIVFCRLTILQKQFIIMIIIIRCRTGSWIRLWLCKVFATEIVSISWFIWFRYNTILFLKLVSAIFYQIFIFSWNDRPSETMKNAFYFIEKALFVLEMFKFLYFFPFLSTIFRFKRANGSGIIYDVKNWLA